MQCTSTDEDLADLRGATACLCPTTERDLADGIAPSGRLRDAGLELALGSDSNAVIDLFEEARAVELDARSATGARGTHTAAALLHAATAGGARSLGWDDAGMIATGALADLVTVGLDSVRLAGVPGADVVNGVVFAGAAGDVTHVIVGGREIVRDGDHLTIDVAGRASPSRARRLAGVVTLVVDRIGLLVTNDPALGDGPLGVVRDAAVVIDDGVVVAIERAWCRRRPARRRRWTLRDPGIRRQPHAPRLRW